MRVAFGPEKRSALASLSIRLLTSPKVAGARGTSVESTGQTVGQRGGDPAEGLEPTEPDGGDQHQAEHTGTGAEKLPCKLGRRLDTEQAADRRERGNEQEAQRLHRR